MTASHNIIFTSAATCHAMRLFYSHIGRRCFAVAGPSTWNSLPDSLAWLSSESQHFQTSAETRIFCEILTRLT